jgi:hypothetical protein
MSLDGLVVSGRTLGRRVCTMVFAIETLLLLYPYIERKYALCYLCVIPCLKKLIVCVLHEYGEQGDQCDSLRVLILLH